jgi:hypothetical protein
MHFCEGGCVFGAKKNFGPPPPPLNALSGNFCSLGGSRENLGIGALPRVGRNEAKAIIS